MSLSALCRQRDLLLELNSKLYFPQALEFCDNSAAKSVAFTILYCTFPMCFTRILEVGCDNGESMPSVKVRAMLGSENSHLGT